MILFQVGLDFCPQDSNSSKTIKWVGRAAIGKDRYLTIYLQIHVYSTFGSLLEWSLWGSSILRIMLVLRPPTH